MAITTTIARFSEAANARLEKEYPMDINGHFVLREVTIKFANCPNKASGTVMQIMPLKAKETLMMVGIDVLSAETNAAKAALGTGNNADFWMDDQMLNAVTPTTDSTAAPRGFPWYFVTADTLDLTTSGAAVSDGIIRVWAMIKRT